MQTVKSGGTVQRRKPLAAIRATMDTSNEEESPTTEDHSTSRRPSNRWIGLLVLAALVGLAVLIVSTMIPDDPLELQEKELEEKESKEREDSRHTYMQPSLPIKIACAGDSLTLGKIGNKPGDDYPDQLQQALGTFDVQNFGVNSVTAIRGLSPSYNRTAFFQSSLEFNSHIYLLMLGTNDAKFWAEHGDTFEGDMEWIVHTVRTYNESSSARRPRIILALPPWIKQDFGAITNDILLNKVIPAIKAFATKSQLPLVDMYAVTYGKDEYYIGDNLHLNSIGYSVLKDVWKAAILCNNNDICDIGENCQSCPKDCSVHCP
jgi:lysophospholipase L1-like esterase